MRIISKSLLLVGGVIMSFVAIPLHPSPVHADMAPFPRDGPIQKCAGNDANLDINSFKSCVQQPSTTSGTSIEKQIRATLRTGNFPMRYVVNLVVEVGVAVLFLLLIYKKLFLLYKKSVLKILATVALGNLISLPLLYYFVSKARDADFSLLGALVIGEMAVWLFEAALIYGLNRKRIGKLSSLAFSLTTNTVTIGLSVVLFLK